MEYKTLTFTIQQHRNRFEQVRVLVSSEDAYFTREADLGRMGLPLDIENSC